MRDLKRGRCSLLMSGMLDDPAHEFWFAIYGQTLAADLGPLALSAELVGLRADHLRWSGTGRNGLRYKIELVNDAGTLKTGKKARCAGGGK